MNNFHYRILESIGEGQFGRVFCAIHRQTGELFAVKELNPRKISTKQFLREIRILFSLNHPNIVSCQGVEHNNQDRYLVTDYCEGGTLRDLMELECDLNLAQKLKLISDILAGLNHAHLHHIIHRDLKPENILLNLIPHGWIARLTDFGISKLEQEDKKTNVSLGDTGSPAYMAPEQFYGKYSYRSDIYAMGIILYELLLGKRPFSGSPNEIMLGHLNRHITLPDTIPLNIRNIIKTALQKLPQHRFSSADNMLKAINEAASQLSQNKPLFINIPEKELTYTQIVSYSTQNLIDKLIVFSEKIYLVHNNNINIFNYLIKDNQYVLKKCLNYQFKHKVVDLKITTQNLIVVTEKKFDTYNQYSFYKCQQKLQRFLRINSNKLVYAIDSNQKWLTLGKTSQTKVGFEIIKLLNLKPIQPLLNEVLPQQLISLDKHHGLAIFHNHESDFHNTLLSFFTRRGTWKETFSLSLILTSVTINNQNINYFLAVEKDDNNSENLEVVLISIKPFKVNRIPLNINPDFIISHDNYFLIANKKGKIILIDLEGKNLGKIDLNQTITAIASLSKNNIVVSTYSENKAHLIILKIEIPETDDEF